MEGVPEGVEAADAGDILRGVPPPGADRAARAAWRDGFRLHLMRRTPHVWVAPDMLCLRPWRLDRPLVAGWADAARRRVTGGALRLPAGSAALRALLAGRGGEFGIGALTRLLVETGEIAEVRPETVFCPVAADDRADLRKPGDPVTPSLETATLGVRLWARGLRGRADVPEDRAADPESFIGLALARHSIASGPSPGLPVPPGAGPFAPPAALRSARIADAADSPRFQARFDTLERRGDARFGYLPDPPAPQRDDRVLIVGAMKNEGPYILDWVAWHLSIGVTHFLIYTNDCADGTIEILDRLGRMGFVTRLDNPWRAGAARGPQHLVYKLCPERPEYRAADWIANIDVDEFINIHVGDGTLPALFAAANRPNMVSMTWRFFGNGGIDTIEDRPVTEQFLRCAPRFLPRPRVGWGFKTMFHRSLPFEKPGTHRPQNLDPRARGAVRWVNGSGRVMPEDGLERGLWMSGVHTIGYRLVTLNHYVLRSARAYLVKRDRGRGIHHQDELGLYYWVRRNYNSEEDRRAAAAPAMRAKRAELLDDPELARLHAASLRWHRDRAETLLRQPPYRHLYEEITSGRWPDPVTLGKEEAIRLVKGHAVEGHTRHWFGRERREI